MTFSGPVDPSYRTWFLHTHLLRIVGMLHQVEGVGAGRSLQGARSAWPYRQSQRRAAGSCGTPIGPRRASIHSSGPAATGFSTHHPFKRQSVRPWLFSEHPGVTVAAITSSPSPSLRPFLTCRMITASHTVADNELRRGGYARSSVVGVAGGPDNAPPTLPRSWIGSPLCQRHCDGIAMPSRAPVIPCIAESYANGVSRRTRRPGFYDVRPHRGEGGACFFKPSSTVASPR